METMDKPLLNEQAIFPSNEVLKSVLAESYHAFEQLSVILANEKGLVLEWNYYKDGHSWLCKTLNRKKNLFWLSVWDKFFKASFYFTEKDVRQNSLFVFSHVPTQLLRFIGGYSFLTTKFFYSLNYVMS